MGKHPISLPKFWKKVTFLETDKNYLMSISSYANSYCISDNIMHQKDKGKVRP